MRAALLAAALLAACQQAEPPGRVSGLGLRPAEGGLLVDGSGGREIGFGRDRAGVLESVARVEGRVPRAVACGGGRDAVETDGGLRLVFEAGTFVGWSGARASAGRICA